MSIASRHRFRGGLLRTAAAVSVLALSLAAGQAHAIDIVYDNANITVNGPGGIFYSDNVIFGFGSGTASSLQVTDPGLIGVANYLIFGVSGTGVGVVESGGRILAGNIALGAQAGGYGELSVAGGTVTTGAVRVAPSVGSSGLLNVAAGGLLVANTVQVNAGGALAGGGGTVQANVTVDGTLAPGNSPGVMTILGNLDLGVSSAALIELGGTAPGQFDQVNVSDDPDTGAAEGVLTLSGLIDVSWYDGFTASLGDMFDIFTATDIVVAGGSWALPGLGGGLVWMTDVVTLESGREALRLLVAADTVVSVAEPAGLAFLLAGLAAMAAVRRRAAVLA